MYNEIVIDMKKSKTLINSLIVLILSVLLVWYFLKDNYKVSLEVLHNANLWWLFLAVIIYLVYFLLETLLLKKLVNIHKKDYSYLSSFKLYLMTKFFNGITPFSSGGQPLQLIEMKKEGVSYLDGTTVLIKHFIILQCSIVFLSIVSLILNLIFRWAMPTGFLNVILIIGFAINYLLLFIVIFLSYKINICEKVCEFFVNIGYKLKLIKSKEDKIKSIRKSCEDYQKSYKELVNNKIYFARLILLESLALAFAFAVPFFVFKTIGCPYNNFLAIFVLSVFKFLIGSFVPIPGGTGGMEYAYIHLYEFVIPSMYLSVSLILWRVIDYYAPMIIGGIFFNIEKAKRDFKKVQ